MCLLYAVTIMINVVATYCMYSLAYKYDVLGCFDKATVVRTSSQATFHIYTAYII